MVNREKSAPAAAPLPLTPPRHFALGALRRNAAAKTFSGGNLQITEQRRSALIAIQGKPPAAMHGALQSLQLNRPPAPRRAIHNNDMRLLWHGPGAWLATSETLSPEALHQKLQQATGTTTAALTDLSHARTIIQLTGPPTLDLLATGCPTDTTPLPPDTTFAGLFWGFNVLIDIRDKQRVEIHTYRSFGRALWDHLERISTEFYSR